MSIALLSYVRGLTHIRECAHEHRLSLQPLIRYAVAVLMMVMAGSVTSEAWGQHPFTLTTAADVTNGTETLYWIESNGATGFFMIPRTDSDGSNVSTSNMPNERMLWYFMDAGIENATQYYYIVNRTTRKYLNLKGNLGADNSIGMAGTSSETCKFSITGTTDNWLFQPKSGNTYYVNKKGSNVNFTNGLKSSTANDANSKWHFVAKDDVTFAHPFVNSTDGDIHYYLIQNKHKSYNNYYFSTDGNYAAVSTDNNDNRIWYFIEAASDATFPQLKYYYLVNANTDKYLFFNSATVNGNSITSDANAVDIRDYAVGADEDRYQFAILDANGNTYSAYCIVPKKLIGLYNDKFNALGVATTSMANNAHIGTLKDRGSNDNTAHWVLSTTTFVHAPNFTYNSATGQVSLTTELAGATIYYTTNGDTPEAIEANRYTTPITLTSSMSAIKAFLVTSDSKVSRVITIPLANYTYNILNLAGNVAIQQTKVQPVGHPLSGFADIPEAIASPYIADETVKFYSSSTTTDENEIHATPSGTTNIFVTYTTGLLMEKYLHLRSIRTFNITINGEYIYDNGSAGSGVLAHKATPTDLEKASTQFLWFFGSGTPDPYAVQIKNAKTNNLIGYTTPSTISLETNPTHKFFILMATERHDADGYEQMELMAATGDDNYYRIGRPDDFNLSTTSGTVTVQAHVFVNTEAVTYHLIDQAGKELLEVSSTSDQVLLPSEWQSPLVSAYHYWKIGAFDIYGDTYKLKADPSSYAISNMLDVEDGVIYVTYDVNDLIDFDIKDDDTNGSTTYMLKFYDGENFYQENGKDEVMTSPQKAVYPYSNGDAMLYVYGEEQWNSQLATGASTRSRWLWYVVSPQAAEVEVSQDNFVPVTPGYHGDPYHVKIMSYSGQANSHNYLRTYAVTYHDRETNQDVTRIVTGVTTKNAAAASQPPTEYMILNAANSHYKLVTVNKIEDEYRTVDSFEQYWRNNPTIQDLLGATPVTTPETSSGNDVTLTTDQISKLPTSWHRYQAFANAAPWVSWSDDSENPTSKQYQNKDHWFQTIDMGSAFTFEATTLEPLVILLDQHGWEIMRMPMSNTAELRKYDSPMVDTYHWYPIATKAANYHKFTVGNARIPIYEYVHNDLTDKWSWVNSGEYYTHTSSSLADNPYDHITPTQDNSVKTDFYVTYTVKSRYASLYTGAATKEATKASSFLVKQGSVYAKNEGNQLATATIAEPIDFESLNDNVKWNLMPNFDIDAEMGYIYKGNPGASDDAETQSDLETAYYNAGKNGFDPYNVQIQSAANTYYYFKANTTNPHLTNVWTGTSNTVSLANMSAGQLADIEGYDQSRLTITNSTFMVVNDGNNHMRLMPRFDHSKVLTSLTSPQLTAANANTDYLTITLTPIVAYSTDDLSVMGGQYILADHFEIKDDFIPLGMDGIPFTGYIDGRYHTISGLETPLVAYANNAVIKNIILDNVNITSGNHEDNLGALVCAATGDTRIYNCGILNGSVGNTDMNYVGGLVGLLDGSSRVINCYSYATITNGTEVGGIVGYNNVSSTANNIKTMVMNCMFYGDITGGTTVAPVYGGKEIANLHGGLNTFNFYAFDELNTENSETIDKYNCALAIEERFLKRFEIYRQLLNSNKRLAAYYATDDKDNGDQMAKWILETADRSIENPKPYPVLRERLFGQKYPSIINYDATNAPDSTAIGRTHGGKLGKTLSVTINQGANAPTGASISVGHLTLQRTDKDFERFNFNYDKIQLPYYNDVGSGNYTRNKVVTGWKITSITGGTAGTYNPSDEWNGYNFADRKCTKKDLFSESGRIFSQGAYFDVPYGVTAIVIEPYWGTAAYLADEYLDAVCNTGYTIQGVKQLGKQFDEQTITIDGSTQTVYTNMTDALTALSGSTVYDNAVVLVGNFHQSSVPSGDKNKSFTMMSVDLNHDNEPDYSYIYNHNSRAAVSPLRFDFLNIPGTAQAQKPKGATTIRNTAIFKTWGWFEITNTALMYYSQFEYENIQDLKNWLYAPLILHGGTFDQFVSTQNKSIPGKTIYVHVGSNVWMKSFALGTHGDGSYSAPHVPISVTGGEFEGLYLTGTYNQNAGASGGIKDDDAECYISGGRFGEMAGAGLEQLGATGSSEHGHVHWQIYNADIENFYGGGINDAKPVQGNITTDIYNSYVTTFCGGPKFGNMVSGKTVTTNAVGCTFGKYFGAGYGGVSYNRQKYYDHTSYNFSTLASQYLADQGNYYDGHSTILKSQHDNGAQTYGYKGPGVATDFDYEFFVWTNGTPGARFYVKFASFSLAQCNDVVSNLKNCVINSSFYGGGSLGNVTGKATSVLDGCTVNGNVFGGGYSASIPTIPFRTGGFTKNPYYNPNTGMFEPGVFSESTNYNWTHVDEYPANGTAGTSDGNKVITTIDLNALGKVGETDLTIKGNTKVSGIVTGETLGGVFGGGDMSAVQGNTFVDIQATHSDGVVNVFGGGNTADVIGNTEVRMTGGKVTHDVFGGGKGATTEVATATVHFGKESETPGSYEGTGIVNGNIYGGSALGTVNAAVVNLYHGTIDADTNDGTTGNVFGGGMGAYNVEHPTEDKAVVTTKATVNQYGATVPYGIFGGCNTHGTVVDTEVNLFGGTVGTAFASAPATLPDRVFGGGLGAQTSVTGTTLVELKPTANLASMNIYGNVYGGSKNGSVTVADVNLLGGTVWGNVFGGGYQTAVGKTAATDVTVTLDGTKFDRTYAGTAQIFGANNLQGTPTGHVKVWVKKTVNSNKPTVDGEDNPIARAARTTYDVSAVYGGGNEADYIPTDALLDPAGEGNQALIDAAHAEVIIEGCEETSIEYVYGGGNAAAVPATDVTVKGSYIIDYLFGGGNGAGVGNPGANVGIYNNGATNYGTGKAVTRLIGGHINEVYGGSNTKGNVRGGTSVVQTTSAGSAPEYCSTLDVGKIYGAGKNAEQDGGTNIVLGCMPDLWIDEIYAGAQNADVAGDVNLTITSGKFYRVFGGNKDGGLLKGSITVNIEETGECGTPIVIGELYGGGNLAGYSIYGYKNYGSEETPDWRPRTQAEYNSWFSNLSAADQLKQENLPYSNPKVNVRSFTSIGSIYGGGYQALMIADPHVDINAVKGSQAAKARGEETISNVSIKKKNESTGAIEDATITLHLPAHAANKIGAIDNVFGGGNLATVDGNTEVNIGTETMVGFVTEPVHLRPDAEIPLEKNALTGLYDVTVKGADIRGNVYGGGNQANITGNTQVNVCAKYSESESKYVRVAEGDEGVTIEGDIFGAGKGVTEDVTAAMVSGNSIIYMSGGEVKQSVYGGGQLSQVTGNTYITVNAGTIGTESQGGDTYGNVYGGGRGNTTNVGAGLVKGDTEINIQNIVDDEGAILNSPIILHNIYGGGAHGSVGTFTYDGSNNITGCTSGGTARITITGGTIGTTGKENGMVFGSSRGDVETPTGEPAVDPNDCMAWVNQTYVVIGTKGQAGTLTTPLIKGSVYGSGENGHTYNNTNVTIYSGTIGINSATVVTYQDNLEDPDEVTFNDKAYNYPYRGNVYGGGCGTDMYWIDANGDDVKDSGEMHYNPKAGFVRGTATVNINGGLVVHNVYGAGAMGSVGSKTTVNINNGVVGAEGSDYGYVYAAARGDESLDDSKQAYVGASELNIAGGIVRGDAFGGGQSGIVKGAVEVTMSGGTVAQDVYGGGALAKTNTDYDSSTHPTYTTTVSMSGGTISGNLYGGGLGEKNGVSSGTRDILADVNGPVTVTVTGGTTANVFGCNNINGAPQSIAVVEIGAKSSGGDLSGSGAISGSIYGGGKDAAYTGNPIVRIYGGTVSANVYGGGLGVTATVTGNTSVSMEGGIVSNNVYGGGSEADVTGDVSVNISGGTVVNDVYGGGALANTNTANWDATANDGKGDWKVASSEATDYYIPVKHLTVGTSVVTGYYTTTDDVSYTEVAKTEPETKAAEGKTYYKKITLPANIYTVATSGTTYKTTVSATGGLIGNIYGGGLGQLGTSPIAAMVYGDVTVTVNGATFSNELVSYNYTEAEAITYNGGLDGALGSVDPLTAEQATAYNAAMQPATAKVAGDTLTPAESAAYNAKLSGAVSTSDSKNVAKTGRVFGCNNLNGTPKGKVLVQVDQTVRKDGGAHVDDDFEILAVYGGGNAANYEPQTYDLTTEFGQHTRVVINGCNIVSIEKVYGGGNAAVVPFTDVDIEGAFQIGYVFGGGNGGDRLYYNESWHENLGANVTGYANVLLRGGTIGMVFGGSDTRGSVGGTDSRQEPGSCPLQIVNYYGAGNGEEATTESDVIVTVSGCSNSSINKVFGGSYKANVKGSITLNITSGIFTSVYGGNDRMGSVGGNITVNIEETENCETPIIIQNLFGGCYETPYPGASASTYNGSSYTPFTRGKITVNVKSATRIDKIYGGSYKASVNGDTEVNINMTKGSRAGQAFTLPQGYRGNPIPNIPDVPVYREVTGLTYLPDESASSVEGYYIYDGGNYTQQGENAKAESGVHYFEIERMQATIDDAIGTIGSVFGGGYQGIVNGDAVVNIGTETEIDYATPVTHLTPNEHSKYDVCGAHIEHDVFGGGNLADVTGNTEVNICAKDNGSGYVAVAEGAEKVTIGGAVYGGGSDGDVLKNTNVTMFGSEVFDGIYGGGLRGSVGTFTRDKNVTTDTNFNHSTHSDVCLGKPTKCEDYTGLCTVVVKGGIVGHVGVATEGMTRAVGGPVEEGWVFGGGRGVVEDPLADHDTHFKTYVANTDVTIGGTAFVLSSVIGGGEFGRVLYNTLVKIEGGQIGVGKDQTETIGGVLKPKRYTDEQFINPLTTTITNENALAECSHWPYGRNKGTEESPIWVYEAFDPYWNKYPETHLDGGNTNPSDGKTWIGCVWGGGSGYYPYEKADGTGYGWLESGGWVGGDSEVRISGGHILTNVYGGCEYTSVAGKSTVKMSGGTIGVPRTLEQIEAHPVTCYLFGAGKGDQRSYFNKFTNVGSVEVEVSGGIIYGSVFGGSEDGHVTGNVLVNIKPGAVIGTWGTSYVDGNVFGGGRGFSGENILAGNVGGNVSVNITGGTMLGSVYGGGRLASVGLDATTGVMQEGDGHGHVTVDISDGTGSTGKTVIGNKYEFMYLTSSLSTTGMEAEEIAAARKAELKNTYHVTTPDVTYQLASRTGDYDHYMINHTRGGCVYGGGMGRRELLDGTKNTVVDWTKLGNVKSTKVNIHGTNVWIKGSLFAGGEYGAVTGSHTSADSKTVGTEAIIDGAVTIGSVIGKTNDIFNGTLDSDNRTQTGSDDDSRYCYGGAYGGGFGTEVDATLSTPISEIKNFGALVSSNTSIKLLSGAVRSSLYGGGKVACVAGDTYVTVSGGTIGVGQTRQNAHPSMGANYVLFGGMRMGNVCGGGRGSVNSVVAGVIKGNTNINITGGNIYHNVYGGGALGSVGDFDLTTDANKASYGVMYANVPVNWKENTGLATINITGGTIGTNGHDSGMVNGSSRGDISTNHPTSIAVSDPYDHVAWVNKSIVTIGTAGQGFASPQPQIKGSVYGGGENGHNYGDAEVYVHSGTIGVVDSPEDTWSNRGAVYGAGCGTDTYSKHYDEDSDTYVNYSDGYNHYNPMGGRVQGNTTVSIDGGHIIRNVYGAGSMGSVSGNATVTVSGGRIGTDGDGNGSVYGGPKGNLRIDPTDSHAEAHVENTTVTIDYATTPATDDGSTTHTITGSVYGGGEAGLVRGNATVNMYSGLVLKNLYGGGNMANVNGNTFVALKGGMITEDAFGGGRGTATVAPEVGGNVIVELNNNKNGATADGTLKGCIVKRIFGCNDLNGTPKGHVTVHVYATQHVDKKAIYDDSEGKDDTYQKYDTFEDKTTYTTSNYSGLTTLATTVGVDVSSYITILGGDGTESEKTAALANMIEAIANKKYDVQAVYGGGNLAYYDPTDAHSENVTQVNAARTEVIIDGCDLTSIKQVYGGSNAASTPSTYVRVNGAYEIDELFGGGNGKDNYLYSEDGKWHQNPGANVGYWDFTETGTGTGETAADPILHNDKADGDTKEERVNNYSYGSGTATTEIVGGRIHYIYGGSNSRGNIRGEVTSTFQESGTCPLAYDKAYGAGKDAITDGHINVTLDCVKGEQGQIFGGSTSADVNSDINLVITNGSYAQVFGGNDTSGRIYGSITVTVQEQGCQPIRIGELYGGGYLAPYSIYGYYQDAESVWHTRTKAEFEAARTAALSGVDESDATAVEAALTAAGLKGLPYRNPHVLVVSATEIGKIFGGGYRAEIVGSPHINVNMEQGHVLAKYVDANFSVGNHTDAQSRPYTVDAIVSEAGPTNGDALLAIGTIGNIFGGGNEANIDGDTRVEIGTGTMHNEIEEEVPITPARNAATITESVYGGGNNGNITGNTFIYMANGSVADRIFGGGKLGNVGTISSRTTPIGHSHEGVCIQKPSAIADGTGTCTIVVSGGKVGKDNMLMTKIGGPDDYGYVFGGGKGDLDDPANDPDIDFKTYVKDTYVTISDSAFVLGGVYGGGENGRVLQDTHVSIEGGQIGCGAGRTTAYAEEDFIDPTASTAEEIEAKAATMPQCSAWPYGQGDGNNRFTTYDPNALASGYYDAGGTLSTGGGRPTGDDGHTFYGNVFGGGSGFYAYLKKKANSSDPDNYDWLPSAGLVEGDTHLTISGGHILSNVYGGNEMTDVTGTCYVTMTGGTIGVPRTLDQILAHPTLCFLFGAGKGDPRRHFNTNTNVGNVVVDVSGGTIYGSVFGGGEDGHVQGNVTMNISSGAKIGTWGTSYVDGNVFGGGRGFSGISYTAGNVAGSVTMNISGGTMLGSVYGGGRLGSVGYGLFPSTGEGSENYGKMQPDNKDDKGAAKADFPRGHTSISISGGTIGNKYEFIYPQEGNIPDGLDADFKNWKTETGKVDDEKWTIWKNYNHVPNTVFDTSNGRVTHTKGGNVFAGGMGRRELLDGVTENTTIDWKKLGSVKSTSLTVTGNPWIMSCVYGGGEIGAVVPYVNGSTEGGTTTIDIQGGVIGSEITGSTVVKETIPVPTDSISRSAVKYTFGSVYGGGMGTQEHGLTKDHGGEVGSNATVSISGANTKVRASVFGGGEMAVVGGSTTVNVSGGEIGRNEVKPFKDPDAGYVLFGSSTMGNVYGGGKGRLGDSHTGQVKGNTNINISGGSIYHMVYGGGALGSVGTFRLAHRNWDNTGALSPDTDLEDIPDSIPLEWRAGTGNTTINITGGTIGISGRDNGLVFGSSRGDLTRPTGSPLRDPYDYVAWINNSVVNIGTKNSSDLTTPHIKASLYGGGENGHNKGNATVNVYSGTIGITDTADPWYSFIDKDLEARVQKYRGNVYGGGSGADSYSVTVGENESAKKYKYYNPKSGFIAGNTTVNIEGGHVGRNVYGGGATASVGTITNAADTISTTKAKHADEATSFALSWPYKMEFAPGTGKATVNITGGHIGTRTLDGGDVYGSARGEAGDRYAMAHLAYTNETEVNITYPTTYVAPTETTILNDFTTPCITGSVHGSGEDGYVHGNTKVTLNEGLIGHSLYGGGKGKGTYTYTLSRIDGGAPYEATIYSLIAGRVLGNTHVIMNGGHVVRNVYGGGNLASVGKGNYSGGPDDYSIEGYGETLANGDNLWTSTFNPEAEITDSNKPDNAYYFLSSGKTTVEVKGGQVGSIFETRKDNFKEGLPLGNVFGGSRGEAAPNVPASALPRYQYCSGFFSGYVNETDVTIGAIGTAGPTILGSVFGGGQDGHVRRGTHVTVNSGTIGLPYTTANTDLLKTTDIQDSLWLYRGNVFGAGSGISEYTYHFNNDDDYDDSYTEGNITYKEKGHSTSAGSVTLSTEVEIKGGTIYQNVYGGGSLASVGPPKITQPQFAERKGTNPSLWGMQSLNLVSIGGGKTAGGDVVEAKIGDENSITHGYGGNVFGGSRGEASLGSDFATSIWTQVNLKNGAYVLGNVFGGGNAGEVMKDTKVNVGTNDSE